MMNTKYPALILAAGLSSRMGFPKLLLAEKNELLFERMIRNLKLINWGEICIVLSDLHLADLVSERQPEINIIHNQFPERGMISSIRLGLAEAHENAAGILTLPIDHPLVSIETLNAMRNTAESGSVVIPTFQGRRGHPTWWGKSYWNYLNDTHADNGANAILRLLEVKIKEIPVDDDGVLININTPELATKHNLMRYIETDD